MNRNVDVSDKNNLTSRHACATCADWFDIKLWFCFEIIEISGNSENDHSTKLSDRKQVTHKNQIELMT